MKNLYEIDPNNSFNQLKCLQQFLKEENSLRETFENTRKSLIKKIELQCYQLYKVKIAIQNICDRTIPSQSKSNDKPNDTFIEYQLIEKVQAAIPQCYDPLFKLVFHFRSSNERMLTLIDKAIPEYYEDLATFLCHYCYTNIFSPDYESGNLLMMIYLLLEKEIDIIKKTRANIFLDTSSSFIAKVLKNLLRKNEIKDYVEKILVNILSDINGLNNNMEDNDEFISFDPNEIREYLKEHCKMKLNKNYRTIEPIKLLCKNLKVSKVHKAEVKGKYSEKFNEDNSFYLNKSKGIDSIILNVRKEEIDKDDRDDITRFLDDTGLFENSPNPNSYEAKNFDDNITTDYFINLTKSELISRNVIENSSDMREFYTKIIKSFAKDPDVFTNHKLIDILTNNNNQKDINIEKVILIYKYSFEKIKKLLDSIFSALIEYSSSIPYIIRCICSIIDRLISIKFKGASQIEKNYFVSRFFFNILLFPIINNPGYNGILVKEDKATETKSIKIDIIKKVIRKLLKGSFFQSSHNSEVCYTLFNMYIIEIMPKIFEIFEHLRNAKLPPYIERLLQQKEFDNDNLHQRNVEFDYFKEFPNDDIEVQTVCLTWSDFIILFKTIEQNERELAGDQDDFFFKTYKKIRFNEMTINKKIEEDKKNNKRTYIFFHQTNFKGSLKTAFEEKKSKKFSFQSNDNPKENDNANFILSRVKYSIGTIIKHLNILTQANFFVDGSEFTADFVKGLTRMMELEGFSEILKEKTIPLSWFGLYLIANIDNIPPEKKRSNYLNLYKELVNESLNNLNEIKNDNSMNYAYSKIKIADKSIEFENGNLHKINITKWKYRIFKFIKEAKIELCLSVNNKDQQFEGIEIHLVSKCKDNPKMHIYSKGKNNNHIYKKECNTIKEIADSFPHVVGCDLEVIDFLEFENEKNIPRTINDLFDIIEQFVDSEDIFSTASKEEKYYINYEIQNYLYQKIYFKVFPEIQIKEDVDIYAKCVIESWVEPKHFGSNFVLVDMNILQVGVKLIKQIDNDYSPFNKVYTLKKAIELLKSIERLYDENYRDNQQLKLLVYIIIKAMPLQLSSNLAYIDYFYPQLQGYECSAILNQMKNAIAKISRLSYKDLDGVSELEFDRNERKVREGI